MCRPPPGKPLAGCENRVRQAKVSAMYKNLILTASVLVAAPAAADDISAEDAFIDANLLAIFYHELGHAVIDVMNVPIFGQEEDAADVMSVLLIDWLFDEETAQSLAYDSAFGYINDPDQSEAVAYWDLHGPDEQRFYNHVCLFYGANPNERAALAEDLGLPQERAETCPEEYDLAAESWGSVFDAMDKSASDWDMKLLDGAGAHVSRIESVLAAEIEALNAEFAFPEEITVQVMSCGEANAYYDPNDISITMCSEFADHLLEVFALFGVGE